MGKPTGFMDYKRETSVSEAPLSVSEILTNSTHHCQRKNSRYRARAA